VLGGGLRGAPLRFICLQRLRGAPRKPPSSIIAFRAWAASTMLEILVSLCGTSHTRLGVKEKICSLEVMVFV
jgi:hypothetical protein